MSQTANRVIKNTGYLYAKMAITMFVSLYTTRLILNSLGASDFGIYNIVGGAIAMLGFLNSSMAASTQRFMSYAEGEGNKEKQKHIFNVGIILHLAISVVVIVSLVIAGFIFFNGVLNIPSDRVFAAKVVYTSLIVSTVLTIVNVPYDAVMNAHENMRYYAFVGILESLLKLLVALACVFSSSDKLIVYGVLMSMIPLVTLTIMKVYCHRNYEECRINPRVYFDKGLMKEMTAFAGWGFLSSLASIGSTYGLGLVLNNFFGTIANAAQGVANQISGQLGALGSSIKKALNPVIAKSAGSGDQGLMLKSSITGTKITSFIVTVFFAPIMVDMDYILHLWLKNPPTYATTFCFLLLIVNFLQDLTLFIPQAISAMGKIKDYTIYGSIISFLPIVMSIVLFSIGVGPEYLYITLMISALIKILLDLYYGQKLCNINALYFFRHVIVRMTICFSFSILIGCLLKSQMIESLVRLVVVCSVTMITYSVVFYLYGLDKDEKRLAGDVITKIKSHVKR